MNPPINGQNMAVKIYEPGPTRAADGSQRSGVQRDLLAGRRKRPRDLQPSLLPEHEAKLARRAESVGMRRAESRACLGPSDRAEEILMKEAVFAARFCRCGATVRHTRPTPRSYLQFNFGAVASKRISPPSRNDDSRKTQKLPVRLNTCKLRVVRAPHEEPLQFP
jgi:hypothetical protein